MTLELSDVSVRFGDTIALDGIDLTVAEGETVAVIGPSGCGKSTLLRAIGGLQAIASGRVSLNGRDLASVPAHQRGVGLMFQDHALFPHLDVAGNIGFGLEMVGASATDRDARVAQMLELVGLSGFAERAVDALSGGEAQRVALARALAPAPSLLMLDEPLGSLDRVLREQLTGDLRSMIAGVGTTTIHVTHDQTEAFALADRVVVLRDGRIEQSGTPSELWHRPASLFVAEFVGHTNLWPRPDGGTDVVPITALAPVDRQPEPDTDGDVVVVTVKAVTFREGRHLVDSVRADGVTVSYETVDRPEVGDIVTLHVSRRVVVA